MYLLIQKQQIKHLYCHLQFTSHYVSINSCSAFGVYGLLSTFTSHYVSINSCSRRVLLASVNHLHPTMYLLILYSINPITALNIYLHPTMYLLIPVIIKASLFLNSEALFCLPFKSAKRLLILYALNMPEA